MYKRESNVGLVTIASQIDENLALLDADEHLNAETLAVVHDGYVNVIPLMSSSRRAKYMSIGTGQDRGRGFVKKIKWIKMHKETLFIVLSTVGLQIYDAGLTEMRYFNSCKLGRNSESSATSVCAIRDKYICVGTDFGALWFFETNYDHSEFILVSKISLDLHSVTVLGCMDNYIVAGNEDTINVWIGDTSRTFVSLEKRRKLNVEGLISAPSTLQIFNYLVFIGYDSGEFCIYDLLDETVFLRTVGHKLRITMIDFSILKHLILTVALDCFVKIWSYNNNSEPTCIYSIFNDNGPLCGGGFMNLSCTEFCIVTVNSLDVDFYIKSEENQDEGDTKKTSYDL